MSIADDIAALDAGALVEFFELDLTPIDAAAPVKYFHAGTNELRRAVVWQGVSYDAYPVEASDFEWNGKGRLPRPKLTVANVTGLISGLVLQYQDMLGARVTRRRTLVKYLDAVNFPGAVNPTADPQQYLPDEVYFIDRKSSETKIAVQFELAAAFDVTNVQLPLRQVIENVCTWRYRGAECGYTGGPVADANDNPTSDPTKDVCGHRVVSCKLRFGATDPLPYGGFPGAGLVRQ